MTAIDALITDWHETRAPVSTARTQQTNRAVVEHIAKYFKGVEASTLKLREVEKYRNLLLDQRARATAARYLATLRAGCGEEVAHLPIGKLISELNRGPVKVDVWTKYEALQLLYTARQIDLRFAEVLEFLFGTGCRRGEALALQPVDVDRGHKRIHFRRTLALDGSTQEGTKWGGERWCPMSSSIEALLGRVHMSTDPDRVFSRYGRSWVEREFSHQFEKVRTAAEVPPYKLHCTRHTAISWALASGMALRKASEIFGVGQQILERHYAHYVNEEVSMDWGVL